MGRRERLPEEGARMAITMQAAVAAYRDGNNSGRGYAPYTDDATDDRIDTAI